MNRKAVRAWVLYDWANSAFATTVMAAVMPIFYADVAAAGLDGTTKTAYWGYTQSIALIFVVLLSPVLGAIADYSRSKRTFLRFFTYMGALASSLLFFTGEGDWVSASLLVILGTLAYSGGNVFYDAFLTDLVPERERDRVSSRGYAFGYIGGGVLLAVNLAAIQFPKAFFLPDSLVATQLAFLSVGIWWWVFSIPLFRHVREQKGGNAPGARIRPTAMAAVGFRSVGNTLRRLKRYPEVLKFLVAFWFFSDGINTIIKMATIYGREIGIGQTDLIAALLITQFVGIPFTLLFGRIADRFGAMRTLIATLGVYLIIVILGYFMQTASHFYALAILVGTVQGGSQALSRSIFTRLIPAHRNAEFFGFYSLSGKFASIFGPFLFGLVGQFTGSSRFGITSLAFFFLAGIVLLLTVNLQKGKQEAEQVWLEEVGGPYEALKGESGGG
ncbi:UMF1 family MFS transporter [Melghirimyces profundicolus]|uniref:UMF1 family MFS transporter n=1 Tax=Melghirimyces profundicolus TaxID=1242148 RepID=A0A2T6BQ12_9BACL|nr:MFS transporter [Melghirimyces profundicolus]PTX58132.1 UMF1 family MFS transporter [Melghirimyces profundicolus]